ncbi:MAG TPA: glycosyltransferase [Chitinophagaceae bacterium]|nr:glycosyltransferase [Chitinophagaceae bacterium]
MKLYPLITLKRKVEEVLMWPFVEAGKRWAARNPLPAEYDIFFFFPIYGLGGAEKVNADIVACMSDKKVIIFFTRTSHDNTMLHFFKRPYVTIRDISRYADNKWRYWQNLFYRGVCAHYINRQHKKPVVFNGQCNFGYKLFPHLASNIRTVELIHNSFKHFAWITFPYIPFINQRIMITDCHIKDHCTYYDEIGIDPKYKTRLQKIINKIDVPSNAGAKTAYGDRLNFYYAGRGGPQKRVWLLVKAMQECLQLNLPVAFHLAGNFKAEIPESLLKNCTFHGEITGGDAMAAFHQQMDVLMLTSAFEGFPLVIMEAMINGVVPIATAVDGVPEHITNNINGLLIYDTTNEAAVVQQLVDHIIYLSGNHEKLKELSQQAYQYAQQHFTGETFCNRYRAVMGF